MVKTHTACSFYSLEGVLNAYKSQKGNRIRMWRSIICTNLRSILKRRGSKTLAGVGPVDDLR